MDICVQSVLFPSVLVYSQGNFGLIKGVWDNYFFSNIVMTSRNLIGYI